MDNSVTLFDASESDTDVDTDTITISNLNNHLLAEAQPAINSGEPLHLMLPINTTDTEVGTALARAITNRYGDTGLPEGTINVTFHGNAGDNFGACNVAGMELTVIGTAANDAGREMMGGQIVIRSSLKSQLIEDGGPVAGRSVLARAAGGKLFVAGQVGDYFAKGNKGASAVVEGVGDYGCQQMAGGVVVVMGRVGLNFAEGLSGGEIFVFNESAGDASPLEFSPVTHQPDIELLRHLICRHVRLTGSTKGQEILENWSTHLSRFCKIMPST